MFQFQEVNSEYTYWEKKADFSPWHEQVDSLLHPVTALAFVPLKQNSRPLLFAGEGPFLRIYCHDRLSCLVSERIFDSQSIHGITDLTIPSGPHGKESNTLVLLWGGNSVCLLVVDLFSSQTQPGFKIKRISSIIQTDDWILDASFRPEADNDGNFERDLFYVVLINGHNCLQYLRIQALSYPEYKYELHLCHFIEGPKSILYSAHIGWSSIGRGLVAAGTVLGEVILWSFHSDDITSDSNFPFSCFVHYIFHGHEGSVFGVRISDQPKNSLSIPAGRCLASCSDDRTIRVWDISSADDELDPNILDQSVGDDTHSYRSHEVSCLPLATTMGHSSRIWGLRFLRHTREGSLLLSFGEDATSQIWHLRTQSNFIDSGQIGQPWDDHLQHECVFEFHAKRNIWSATAYRDLDGNFTVSTGGADGRIVCFSLNDDREGLLIAGTSRTAEWTVSNVLDKLSYDDEKNSFEEIIAAKAGVKIMPENVFATFNGQWNVNRRLESGLSTYQSGNFKGMASFEMRSPTDPAYDAEYLYIENGEFCSDQGLVIPATRRYVYRFQRNDNAISAWFVKTEDGLTVDYLFHHVNFPPCNQESFLGTNEMRRRLLKANGQHLCVDDDYKANYLFRFQGLLCNDWELKYMVNGPRKAYSATTQYVRDGLRQIANSDLMSESVLKTMSKSGQQDEVEDGKRVPSKGAFNNYSLVGKDQLLALTTQGYLLQGKIYCSGTQRDGTARNQIKPECLWVKIDQLEDFESSCLVSSIQHPAITIIAGKRGNMYFYQHHQEFLMKSQIQLPEKATYLKAHIFDRCKIPDQNLRKVKLLVISSCLRPLIGYAFHLDVDLEISSYSMSSSFALTLRPHFIVTSSCFAKMEGILFLGSRNGALAIYEYRTSSTVHANLTPSFVSHGINGRDAITVIENLPLKNSTSDTEAYILTAGRDGTYSIHLITTERRRSQVTSFGFQTVHTCKLPFGRNIEGACFNRTTEELWLWGFSSKDFVVWNESRKAKVITVECGGAHRNWAFLPGDDVDAGGQLAWTKASSCRIYSQPQASHQVLQPGGHGREIKAAAVSPPIKLLGGQFAKFVATGAEDTAIRIFLAPEIENDGTQLAPQGVQCLGIFTKHTSGLQQLRWSPNGQFLFSAAACEEFFVWHVRPAPCFKIGLTCEAICPSATEAADLRIMCFDVMEMGSHENETNGASLIHRYLLSMVYSDSTVRVSTTMSPLPSALPPSTKINPPTKIPGIFIRVGFDQTRIPSHLYRHIHDVLSHQSALPPFSQLDPSLYRKH